MLPDSKVKQRVEQFIRDWHEQWEIARMEMKHSVDFARWAGMVSEVDKKHFVPGKVSGTSSSFSSQPDHDPAGEVITSVKVDASVAYVETKARERLYHVFELVYDRDSTWRISQIYNFVKPPGQPVIQEAGRAAVLEQSSENATLEKPDPCLRPDEQLLFTGNRKVSLENLGEGITSVKEIGRLTTRSGCIGIADFAYNVYNFEPLERKVTPGNYSVQAVSVYDRVAALRVRFSEEKAACQWYAAKTRNGNGIYGVDAGNLAIFDVESFAGMTYFNKEVIFSRWSKVQNPEPALFSMAYENDGVITRSGFGDGGYPAFWGVDERGEVVSLFVDFMILVKKDEDGIFSTIS